MSEFFTVLTSIGQAKVAAATISGVPVAITELALGDGGGAAVTPVENRASLVNEVNRGPVGSLTVHPVNANWLIAERVIAPEVGGFTVREVGLFDAAGDLIAYGNFPTSYKPVLAEGSGKELIIRVQIEVGSISAVTLLIDPSVVLASRAYVDSQLAALQTALTNQLAAQRISRPQRYFESQQ